MRPTTKQLVLFISLFAFVHKSGAAFSLESNPSQQQTVPSINNVIQLTDINFDRLVNSSYPWMIVISAPWCPACRELEPEWQALAGELGKHNILCGKIDPKEAALLQRFSIRHFPSIFHLQGAALREYNGPRTVKDMVAWALRGHEKLTPRTGCTSPASLCGRGIGSVLSFPARFKAKYMHLRQYYSDMSLAAGLLAIPLSIGLFSICLLDYYFSRVATDQHLHQQ